MDGFFKVPSCDAASPSANKQRKFENPTRQPSTRSSSSFVRVKSSAIAPLNGNEANRPIPANDLLPAVNGEVHGFGNTDQSPEKSGNPTLPRRRSSASCDLSSSFVLRRVKPLDEDDGLNVVRLDSAKPDFTVGRMRSCDVTIDHVCISRRHAVFRRSPSNQWTLEVLGGNGVEVNGKVVDKGDSIVMTGGMEIRFANDPLPYVFKFEAVSDSCAGGESSYTEANTLDICSAAEDVRQRQLKRVSSLKAAQRQEEKSILHDISVNMEAKQRLEQEMKELGTKLEVQNKTLDEKRAAEEELRRQIAVLAAREESLLSDLRARDQSHRMELERIQRESNARLAELEAQLCCQLLEREEELERQMEAARVAGAACEREAADKKLAEYKEELERLRQTADSEKATIAAAKEDVMKNVDETLAAEFQCPVCQEIFVKAVTLNCSHTFCKECLYKWKRESAQTRTSKGTCPTCRQKVKSINSSLAIDSLVDRMISSMGPEKVADRRRQEAEHEVMRAERHALNSGNQRGGQSGNQQEGSRSGNQRNQQRGRGGRRSRGAANNPSLPLYPSGFSIDLNMAGNSRGQRPVVDLTGGYRPAHYYGSRFHPH